MAGETSQPRKSRPLSATSGDTAASQSTPQPDPTMAPITANTPLPPLTPLPLASQPGDQSAAPAAWDDPAEQPTLSAYVTAPPPKVEAPRPPAARAAGPGVSSTWAAYTLFALFFTSLILVVVMAIAAAIISKNVAVLIWVIILTFVINLIYAGIVFMIARPAPGERVRLPFMNRRRGF